MKRLFLIMLLIPAVVFAQKQPKPNINKAHTLWKEGKLAEAKEIIDLATTYEKTKDDGKTWYYRGLIYASLDTTSSEDLKALAPDAMDVALESFAKADELAKGGSGYFVMDGTNILTKDQQINYWFSTYLNKGANAYQEDNLEDAIVNFEKAQKIYPKDTTAYLYAGIVAMGLEKHDAAIENLNKYIELGGTSKDAYSSIYNIYNGPKEDKQKALEVVREAKEKFPDDATFPKVEIGLLIDLGKIDEAKAGLEKAIEREPDNKVLHFYLGYVNANLNNSEEAVKHYEEALRIDPKYFEAQLYLAREKYKPAAEIKKQMANLGISEADRKKKFELDKVLVGKLKDALPYWEQAERLNPSDQDVLDMLYSMYEDLGMQAQVSRIEKRYKELGLDN